MQVETLDEARRQLEICNACRYCEGYCSTFPAVHRRREFDANAILQLANLCHNCRGCYYACQYTAPHEFALNVPAILADVRQQGWRDHAMPKRFADWFHRSGAAIALAVVAGLTLLLLVIQNWGSWQGEGFYGVLSHQAMIALFIPAFVAPLLLIALGVRSYWRQSGQEPFRLADLVAALGAAAQLRNLAGGHGKGCNFEDEDRFSNLRRWFHQATMYGFLLCFAATCVATLMHYAFDLPAPYPLFSLPKILGISGGLALCAGTAGLGLLKLRADPELGVSAQWGGEMGFILLLFLVSASGLGLYWFGDTAWMAEWLALHLGAVLSFFLMMPYSRMVHGFYRLAALTRDAGERSALTSTVNTDE